MESKHNYDNDCSDFWVYQLNGAASLTITFDERTNVEDGFDYIYIFDAMDKEIGKYTGTELANKVIVLNGDIVKIQLVSDSAGSQWGFKIKSIGDACQHTSTEIKNAKTANCTQAGYTGDTVCKNCGSVIKKGKSINAVGHSKVTSTVKATINKSGSIVMKCKVCGTVISNTAISYPKTITLSKTSVAYTGKVQKPVITVKGSDGKKISSSNYTLTYSGDCKSVGKHTVKITFKGNYDGSVSKSFTIVPKGTNINKLSAMSKGFTAKWKKQKKQTTGYEIQYSTSSKFGGARKLIVSKNSVTSKKITKLKKKKKYYVRIRTYKTVNNVKYYSAWSKAKAVTTKK